MNRGAKLLSGYFVRTLIPTRKRQGNYMKMKLVNGSQRGKAISDGKKSQTHFFGYMAYQGVARQFFGEVSTPPCLKHLLITGQLGNH